MRPTDGPKGESEAASPATQNRRRGKNSGLRNGAPGRSRNVLDELPKGQHGQALNLMRAAWKVKTAEAAILGRQIKSTTQPSKENAA
jgi:hypothetical protein